METKFKVGDKVLITKPTEIISSNLSWVEEMDKFDGRVFEISNTAFIDIWTPPRYGIKESPYIFAESWLTKIEEQPTEQVAKPIDWEQRRWELLCNLILKDRDINYAIEIIDKAIEYCKKHEQKLN